MARCHTHPCAFPIEIRQVVGYAPAVPLYRSDPAAANARVLEIGHEQGPRPVHAHGYVGHVSGPGIAGAWAGAPGCAHLRAVGARDSVLLSLPI